MGRVRSGRWTHDHDGSLAVFLIGMRINRPLAVRAWLPVARAMPPMIAELQADPALGLLASQRYVRPREAVFVQYWRDVDAIIAYASAAEGLHRPAWTAFYASAHRAGGAVGIFHETYSVAAGGHESLYVNMPLSGVVAATTAVEATGRRSTARGRFADGRLSRDR